MPKRIDRTGQKFGNFTIREQKIINKVSFSRCTCDVCGKDKWIRTDAVVSGRDKTCGCVKIDRDKRVGNIYGKLKILKISKGKNPKALCKCLVCGKEKELGLNWVIRNKPDSCGCLHVSDISHKKFGFLEPLEPTEKREGGSVVWRCMCHNCGKECYISNAAMTQRGKKDCGCCDHTIDSEMAKENFEKGLRNGMIDDTNIHQLIEKRARKNSRTGIRGVSQLKNGKYRVRINFKKREYHIGTYSTLEEAKAAREVAAEEIYGEFIEQYKKENPEYWEKITKNKLDK